MKRHLFFLFLVVLCFAASRSEADDPAEAVASIAPGRGVTVRAPDGSASMTLRAGMQLRDTVSMNGDTTNELGVKTARLVVQGHLLSSELRYYLQLAFGPGDFEAGSSSPIYDAYLEWALHRDLQIRAGQYFVPFDRARTIREFALQFVDRPQLVSEFNLDRDVGLTLMSPDLFGLGGRLGYAVGVFAGGGKNRLGGEPIGFLFVARLSYRPFGAFDEDTEGDLERLPRPRLAIGLAGAYNQNTRRQKSTFGNTLTLGGFDYAHAAADVVFKLSGFSFLGEVIYRGASKDFLEGTVNGEAVREVSRSGWGFMAQAGMMLGSRFEVAVRWDRLRALGQTDPALVKLAREQGDEIGGGLSLYLNGHLLKLQADFSARVGQAEPVRLLRVQLDATF